MIEKLTKTGKDKTERRNNKKQTFHNAANQEEKTRERTLLNGRNNCKVKGVVFLQVGTSLQGTVAVCGCYWSSLFNGLFSSVIVISLCEMMARSIEFLRQCIVCPLSDYPPLIMASRWWRSVVSKHVDVSSVALLCSTVTLQVVLFFSLRRVNWMIRSAMVEGDKKPGMCLFRNTSLCPHFISPSNLF